MAKRSRHARRQQTVKQKQPVVSPIIKDEVEPLETVEETPVSQKMVNFAREYFYVYTELRNILIVAIIMFIVMAGLAFFI